MTGTWYNNCTCRPCTSAWSTYVQKCKLAQARGQQRLIAADAAVAHVEHLMDTWGVSEHVVWEAGGCSRQYGHHLMVGNHTKMDRDVAAAVQQVTIRDLPDGCWMDRDHIDPTPAETKPTPA